MTSIATFSLSWQSIFLTFFFFCIVVLQLRSLKIKTHNYASFLESYYDYGLVCVLRILILDACAISKINDSHQGLFTTSFESLKHVDVSLGFAGILIQQSPSLLLHPWQPACDESSFLIAKWQSYRVTCNFGSCL